MGVISR